MINPLHTIFSLFATVKKNSVSSPNSSPEMFNDKVSPGFIGWVNPALLSTESLIWSFLFSIWGMIACSPYESEPFPEEPAHRGNVLQTRANQSVHTLMLQAAQRVPNSEKR